MSPWPGEPVVLSACGRSHFDTSLVGMAEEKGSEPVPGIGDERAARPPPQLLSSQLQRLSLRTCATYRRWSLPWSWPS
jgi:hypothetical protein